MVVPTLSYEPARLALTVQKPIDQTGFPLLVGVGLHIGPVTMLRLAHRRTE
jgi:hypothetical protein